MTTLIIQLICVCALIVVTLVSFAMHRVSYALVPLMAAATLLFGSLSAYVVETQGMVPVAHLLVALTVVFLILEILSLVPAVRGSRNSRTQI